MNFECEFCSNYFENNEQIVEHLKKIHKVKEKTNQIKCTVKNSKCGKYFQTFFGLARHVPECLNQTQNGNISNDVFLNGSEQGKSETTSSKRCESFVFNESDHEVESCSNHRDASFIYDEENEQVCPLEQSIVFDCSNNDTIKPREIASHFLEGLLKLNLNEKTMNDVFNLTLTVLKKTNTICQQSLEMENVIPQEALNSTIHAVCEGLRKFDSSHKRKVFLENQPTFVKWIPIGIGTHWENDRNKATNVSVPVHKQSMYSFVPITNKLSKLFEKPHVRDAYFTYNLKTKHICEPNVYQDFCCGSIYKKTDFFQKYPDCLQLQIFIDGFEICSALKSKTTIHSQVAVYMTILNMPPEFAYCMDDVHFVALVNENDLKKSETDYTNILEQIVKDIRMLEEYGIDVGNGTKLRGKFKRNIYIFVLRINL